MNAVPMDISEQDAAFAPVPGALREQAAQRLAAHRARRLRAATSQHQEPRAIAQREEADRTRPGRIASAVAERYAQTQSYRAFLAAEAENSIRQAEAVAEVAARNAQAIAAAQRDLLDKLDSMPEPAFEPQTAPNVTERTAQPAKQRTSGTGITVRLYEDAGRMPEPETTSSAALKYHVADDLADHRRDFEESRVLDEEIAYRQSPTDELERTSIAIPGNLLEFPRQLVATRKARPRYAEGPLREDADPSDSSSQLRIFEVEAVQTSPATVEPSAPEWSSIWLDALQPSAVQQEQVQDEAHYPLAQRPETAPIGQRLMAAIVDACLIGLAFLGFATFFAYNSPGLPSLPVALAVSTAVVCFLYLAYQMLFFTLSESTPGMRYARIGLCTFADENPSRAAMRRRIFAVLLSACPLGIGFLWACLDDDRLGWHDRISRMYQRSY